jgi:hypothetical protein
MVNVPNPFAAKTPLLQPSLACSAAFTLLHHRVSFTARTPLYEY